MDGDTMECEIECDLECPQCLLNDELCEEDVDWEKVCSLVQENPALCSKRDDWDWYPLHFACYQNAPVSVIEKLVNIWPEGLKETVKMENERTGDLYDETAFELACYASAPDELIVLLGKASHKLGYLNHTAGELLMDMNRHLNVIKKVYDHRGLRRDNDQWEWFHEKEHLFRPQKEINSYHRRAFYRLKHDDADLQEVRIGWPLPSLCALESVVESLATNTSVYRLDICEGDTNLYPKTLDMLQDSWWYGRETYITDLIISGLQRNKSITEIHIKPVSGINLMDIVRIATFCRQLENVTFHRLTINSAEMSYILMHLDVKEVCFKKCNITDNVAEVAVSTLKNYNHTFLSVELFDSWMFTAPSLWVSDDEREFMLRIRRELFLLCSPNNFKVDRNRFIEGFGDQGTRFKYRLNLYCYRGGINVNELRSLRCGNRDKKLWYAGIMAAIKYDKEHDFLWKGDGGQPNMLYSIIREYPNNLKGD
jgi:hypothetical protein